MNIFDGRPEIIVRRKVLLLGVGGLVCGCSPRAAVEPSIEFTRLPPSGEGSAAKLVQIEGRVIGAQPGQQIVIYARSGPWWVQPLLTKPFTTIRPDSTWKNATHPGSAYAALLVRTGFRPPPTIDALPEKGGAVLAVVSVEQAKLAPRQ